MCHRPKPAAPPRTCARSFPGRRDTIRDARAFLVAFLNSCPVTDEAVLLASELCANAVAHSASGQPGGTFTLRAQLSSDGSVHAEVEDQGSRWDGDLSAAECPHGLYLLRALSAACGTRHGDHGLITWFTLTRPYARTQPAEPAELIPTP
jgi:hypothetical protein